MVKFELLPKGSATRLKLTNEGLESFSTNGPDFAKESFMGGWTALIGTSLKDFTEKNKMINKLIGTRPLNADLGILLLRVIFGGFFVYYGYLKVASYYQILPVFTDIIGIGAKLSFHLVIFAELVCGFLVLIGCWTRLAIIPIFITMFVVYFIAHAKDPFTIKQIALLYLLLSLIIFILGSGKYSVDGLLQKRKPS